MSSCFCFWLKYKRTQEAANVRYFFTPLHIELTTVASKNGQIRRSLQASETFFAISYHIVSCHMLNINCTDSSLLMGSMATSCKLWVASHSEYKVISNSSIKQNFQTKPKNVRFPRVGRRPVDARGQHRDVDVDEERGWQLYSGDSVCPVR